VSSYVILPHKPQICCNLAVENLEKAISLDEEYRDMAKNDADFDRIREDSRFQKLI
jgi:hypothetical protein